VGNFHTAPTHGGAQLGVVKETLGASLHLLECYIGVSGQTAHAQLLLPVLDEFLLLPAVPAIKTFRFSSK
jgi:hypothetical protein